MNQSNSPATSSRRFQHMLFAMLTLGIIGLTMLAVGELVVRVVAPQPASWLDIYRRDPELPIHAALPNLERLIDTGESQWVIATDERGFRVAPQPAAGEGSPEPPMRATVLALGDSFTFGHGVNYEDSFVGQLAQRERDLRYVNTALPGYGPVQYRQILERELSRNGQDVGLLLVGTFLGNDFHDCIWNKEPPITDGVLGDPGGLKSTIKRSSHLYRLIAKAVHQLVPHQNEDSQDLRQVYVASEWQPGGGLQRAGEIYQREFARMAELAQQRGVPMLVIVIPARETLQARRGSLEDPTVDYDLPVKFATEHLQALGIPFIDMTPIFAERRLEDLYFEYDGHLTRFGNELVSQAVEKRIPELFAGARGR